LHLAFDTSQSSILRPVRGVLNAIQQRTISLKNVVSPKELGPLALGLPRLGLMRYLHRRLYIDPGTAVLATLDLEQVPQRDWQICADADADADGAGASVAWDVAREDAENAARYIPVCRKILAKLQSEAAFTIDASLPADTTVDFLLDHLKRKATDTFHFAGGLRMSAAADGLVDPQLRFARLPNVYLLSSAVFPRVGTSNPTHTILALADRLAEHLLETS
jgi:choline dehydrogenase-like flavoprotein